MRVERDHSCAPVTVSPTVRVIIDVGKSSCQWLSIRVLRARPLALAWPVLRRLLIVLLHTPRPTPNRRSSLKPLRLPASPTRWPYRS
ncbi:hypothetical protein D3C81_1481710 [compost metagenome]